jgi:hypothetical protein
MYDYAVALSLFLAVLRVAGSTSPSFQAAAHIWVGVLVGLFWANPTWTRAKWLGLAAALTVVETICFLYSRLA